MTWPDAYYGTEDKYSQKADASSHAPSPGETAGITQEAAATALAITDRVLRYYLLS